VNPAVILVTSSRDWKDRALIYSALDLARTLYPDRKLIVRHGMARGGDTIASDWVDSIGNRRLVDEDPHPAELHGPWPAAGPIRNAHMVRLGAEWCLAFINRCRRPQCGNRPVHGSHGAEGCLELAERAGMRTRPWRTF
jgi:hypothetical protein